MDTKNVAVVFVDIKLQELGAEQVLTLSELQDDFRSRTNDALVTKSFGESLLVVYPTVSQAMAFALQLARENCPEVRVRVAVHCGDSILTSNDALGESVNVASRLLQFCRAGSVILSRTVLLLLPSRSFEVKSLGKVYLRGISEAVEAYATIAESELESKRQGGVVQEILNFRRPPRLDDDCIHASVMDRFAAGAIDLWAGVVLMLVCSVFWNVPELVGLWKDVVRVQAEDMQIEEGQLDFRPTAQSPTVSLRKLALLGAHNVVRIEEDGVMSGVFTGPSGSYDVVIARKLQSTERGRYDFFFRVGEERFPLYPLSNESRLKVVACARGVSIETGESFAIRAKDESSQRSLLLDYVEFIPVNSWAYRPQGAENGYRYSDLWRAIDFDDMNVHFSIIPIPFFVFMQLLLSQILMGRSSGAALRGFYFRRLGGERPISLLGSVIRASTCFLFPLFLWGALSSERTWTDTLSGSEMVKLK